MTGIEQVLEHEQVHSVLQPIVDLDTGVVVGYEALARGPRGPLARDQLFAAARSAGRLAELDELCRRVALRRAIVAGVLLPLTLFVNVEPEVLDAAPLDELLAIADTAPGELQARASTSPQPPPRDSGSPASSPRRSPPRRPPRAGTARFG